ncbi:MAG: choice-of-anchor Q domain-containing protein [Deltaproteobacteria bacterium]
MRTGKSQFQVFILVCLTLSIALNFTKAFGATINVPTVDYPTIQAGIDAAADGDTVLVADGTYTGDGNIDLDFKGKAITVTSENGPENTIIDCENNGRGFNFQSGEGQDSVVSGFTITNGKATDGGGIYIYDSSPTISKCIIINCQTKYTSGDYYGGGIYCRAAYSSNPIAPIIENSVIADNKSGRRGAGIYCYGANAKITNCTIYNNSTDNSFDASGGGIYYRDSSPIITNSILWSNYPDALGAFFMGASAAVTYSNIEGGQPGEGNINEYPGLMDPFIGDYRLQDWSPCIGTATSAGAPALDIIGNPRPNPAGSNPDMGAYENSLAIPITRPLDVFAMEVGNQWVYDTITENRVTELDRSNDLRYIYEVEGLVNGNPTGKEWYESSGGKLRWWGFQDEDGYFRYNNGLWVAWFPASVGDRRQSSAGIIGYIGNISLTVDVLAFEPVILSFDTLDAYKFRLKAKVTGPGGTATVTSYWWVVPYLGIVQTQDGGTPSKLTSFAIGRGTITPDTDADNDGLKDYEEVSIYNTDRLDSDTDGDGLYDGEEVNTHETDPNDSDSDDDGLTDWDEVNTHGTDPNSEDTDNDGLTDFEELNTYNTDPNNEDSDGDELSDGDEIAIGTDPNNSDTDADGMPDGWEDAYDLDPLTDDAGDDPDRDGLTNLDEYEKGRHPTNVEPDAPVLLAPGDTETDISTTPQLQTQSFFDTDGHDHASTHWQIGKRIGNPDPCTEESFTSSDYLVFDGKSDSQLTLFNVPAFLLDADTDYCWRARFTDTGDATSEWAEPFAFKTISMDENDQNQNGVPDDQEVDDPDLDLDNNGTPDMNQGDMKCVNTGGGIVQIGVKQGSNVTSIESLMWTDPDTVEDTQNKPDMVPLGLVSFKIRVDNEGDTAEVTVYLSVPAPAGAKWYKYDVINGWQDYSAHAVFSLDRRSVTLQFQDGGFGDTDGVANAIIIDPSGVGTSSSGSGGGGGGGGGGCFISTAASSTHRAATVWLLIAITALIAAGLFRLKRNPLIQ